MRTRLWCVVVAVAIATSGCALEQATYRGYAVPALTADNISASRRLEAALQTSTDADGSIVDPRCFTLAASGAPDVDLVRCRVQRNRAIATLVVASSNLCVQFRETMYGREAIANISLGTLTNLFAGSAAIANSQAAKTLYAALALFSNSERSLVNETVYKTMLVTAVDQKITETMDAKGLAIKGMLGRSYPDYDINRAIIDVVDLHNSCSFMDGLRKALAEGTQGSTTRKITRSRAILASIDDEIVAKCKAPPPTDDATKAQCVELNSRYHAVSLKLVELETVVE